MTKVLHRGQWSNRGLRHLGATQVEVSQLWQLCQIRQTRSSHGCFFQMQCSQMTELPQRGKGAVGDRGTSELGLYDVRGKAHQTRELGIAKFRAGIHGVQDETISQVL